MPDYKIVASDLDGTLLKNDRTISLENDLAIRDMNQRGVYFVPASGRTLAEIPEELKENPDVRYMICANGALIYDKVTGESITEYMSTALTGWVIGVMSRYEAIFVMRCGGKAYMDADRMGDEDFLYHHLSLGYRDYVRNMRILVKDLTGFAREAEQVEVIAGFFHDKEKMEECRRCLEENGALQTASAGTYNLEAFSVKAGKGNALRRLADMLGVEHEATISVGDSTNDRTMIEAAGMGLVMGNGFPEMKEMADEVICTNEEHAIDYILKHYIY